MARLDRPTIARRFVVLAGVLTVPILWGLDKVGGGRYEEHIARWDVQIERSEHGILLQESIDMDFASEHRSGIERSISNALGAPTKVLGFPFSVSPAGKGLQYDVYLAEQVIVGAGEMTVARLRGKTDILSGRQPLIAVYELPTTLAVGSTFQFEVIGADRGVAARDVRVDLGSVVLSDATCRRRSGRPCTLAAVDGVYQVRLSSLPADDSLTIGGTVTGLTKGQSAGVSFVTHEPESLRDAQRLFPTLLWLSPIAGLAGAGLTRWRRRIRNERRWAAIAPAKDPEPEPEVASDVRMPLPSVEPWMGAALLQQQLDEQSAAAWFAQQLAAGVITVEGEHTGVFRRGPHFEDVGLGMLSTFEGMIGKGGMAPATPYRKPVKRAARELLRRQRFELQSRAWWNRFGPGSRDWFSWEVACLAAIWALVLVGLVLSRWSYAWRVSVPLILLLPASVAAAATWFMSPRLSHAGDDTIADLLPMRAFLGSANTADVEAVWRAGQLPAYCAWAVALGTADRWHRVIGMSEIPADEAKELAAPLTLGRSGGVWSPSIDQAGGRTPQ